MGIAILVTVATHTTDAQVASGVAPQQALVDGFSSAFTVGSLIVAAAAGLAALIGPLPRVAEQRLWVATAPE